MLDFLACPHCGEPNSGGELCNLKCRREWLQRLNTMWREREEQPLTMIHRQDVPRLTEALEQHEQWIFNRAVAEVKAQRFMDALNEAQLAAQVETLPQWAKAHHA